MEIRTASDPDCGSPMLGSTWLTGGRCSRELGVTFLYLQDRYQRMMTAPFLHIPLPIEVFNRVGTGPEQECCELIF